MPVVGVTPTTRSIVPHLEKTRPPAPRNGTSSLQEKEQNGSSTLRRGRNVNMLLSEQNHLADGPPDDLHEQIVWSYASRRNVVYVR